MFIYLPTIRPYIDQINHDNNSYTTDTYFALSRAIFFLSQTVVVPLTSSFISKQGTTKNLLLLFVIFYLLGNILYLLAKPLGSVFLVIVSRFCSGIGAGINRLFYEYLHRTVNPSEMSTEFFIFVFLLLYL
eukprot:UN30952